ncbi:MAG: hypothetical protein DIU60_018920 [Actinomycetes bacterium]
MDDAEAGLAPVPGPGTTLISRRTRKPGDAVRLVPASSGESTVV